MAGAANAPSYAINRARAAMQAAPAHITTGPARQNEDLASGIVTTMRVHFGTFQANSRFTMASVAP
jgi:hypothetical protein